MTSLFTRRGFLLGLGVGTLPSWADGAAPGIGLLPYGDVSTERIEALRAALDAAFTLPVTLLAKQALPESAFYKPRQRYRAEKLLAHLRAIEPATQRVIIGLTDHDISTTKGEHPDWGIFGLGEIGGRACVVSTRRLGARDATEAKRRERMGKVGVHEVGHVLGLPHCPTPRCVMRDAESSIQTVDEESGNFCPDCAAKIAGSLK